MENSRKMKVQLWAFSYLAVLVAFFFLNLAMSCTHEFLRVGAFMAGLIIIPMGGIIILIVSLIFVILNSFIRRKKYSQKKERIILLSPAAIMVCTLVIMAVYAILPTSRFKLVSKNSLLKPAEIKVAGVSAFLASRWLIAFQIESHGIELVVKEKGFVETKDLDFNKNVCGDLFLKRVDWLATDAQPVQPIAYKWVNPYPDSSAWAYLFYEPDTKRAWFYSGFQN